MVCLNFFSLLDGCDLLGHSLHTWSASLFLNILTAKKAVCTSSEHVGRPAFLCITSQGQCGVILWPYVNVLTFLSLALGLTSLRIYVQQVWPLGPRGILLTFETEITDCPVEITDCPVENILFYEFTPNYKMSWF